MRGNHLRNCQLPWTVRHLSIIRLVSVEGRFTYDHIGTEAREENLLGAWDQIGAKTGLAKSALPIL
jgi:beta-xylosidase